MPKKILVVDDEKSVCTLIDSALSSAGYEVFTAYSGEKALKKLREISPDLIVLDIMMPKMSGFEVCKKIRKDPLYQKTPILMLTVKDSKDDKTEGFDSGANEYIVKPFNVKALVSRIKIALERS